MCKDSRKGNVCIKQSAGQWPGYGRKWLLHTGTQKGTRVRAPDFDNRAIYWQRTLWGNLVLLALHTLTMLPCLSVRRGQITTCMSWVFPSTMCVSGHEAWWRVSLPTEPSQQPIITLILSKKTQTGQNKDSRECTCDTILSQKQLLYKFPELDLYIKHILLHSRVIKAEGHFQSWSLSFGDVWDRKAVKHPKWENRGQVPGIQLPTISFSHKILHGIINPCVPNLMWTIIKILVYTALPNISGIPWEFWKEITGHSGS